MKRMLEGGRYIVLIGVFSTFIASVAAFIWGAYKTAALLVDLVLIRQDVSASSELVGIMDKFLIATGLYIFAVGIYELFIGGLDVPEWLVVHNLHQIKSRLSSIIILVLAMVFLEHVIEWQDSQSVLQIGIAIAVMIAALIAFNVFGERE